MDEIFLNGITPDGVLKFKFIPQRWHVDYEDNGETKTASFVSRMVAEEAAQNELNAIYYLCDCTGRICKFV